MMRHIHYLEIHVSHGCNLHCNACSHYSNHGHKGMLDPATARAWMEPWRNRVIPKRFSLMGGEPTFNPALVEFVYMAREYWPDCPRLDLVTNGFFLHRFAELPQALKKTNTVLAISIHHNSPAYMEKVDAIRKLVASWDVNIEWRNTYGNWYQKYRGFGSDMMPYQENNPRKSWEICGAWKCTQLHEGCLWKCPNIAYLGMQAEKYQLDPIWDQYLTYQPLKPGCTDEELDMFFNQEEEFICGMCPTQLPKIVKLDPLKKETSQRKLPVL